ncbi:Protein kinase superfamily protein [Euphorbia peplus]|nr:Protein kinase superfamily protein [Euphorbia peplus]
MALHVSQPNSPRHNPTRSSDSRRSTPPNFTTTTTATATAASSSSSAAFAPSSSTGFYTTTASSSTSSRTSLSSLRQSISQNPNIYDISEIRAATNNFLAKRYSSSSSTACWRCTLRNIETIVFQRKFRRKLETSQLKERLAVLCRSNHTSVIRLLGVSISGDHIYLVYEFIAGANLADCLRNKRNPEFTVLSLWDSRMQVAADLAHGLDYIHNKTAQLCGEDPEENEIKRSLNEIKEDDGDRDRSKELKRSSSGTTQFHGVRGYMSPEFQSSGTPTQKSDVYAFGVVILELMSGEEPFKYKYDKTRGDFTRTALTETARAVIDGGDGRDGRDGRLRRWMDSRMKDSFPVEVAEKLVRLALECVHVEENQRPDMSRVAGKISKLYLASKAWSEKSRISDQISVSLAPR